MRSSKVSEGAKGGLRAAGLAILLLAVVAASGSRAASSPFDAFDATLEAFLASNRVSAAWISSSSR